VNRVCCQSQCVSSNGKDKRHISPTTVFRICDVVVSGIGVVGDGMVHVPGRDMGGEPFVSEELILL